MAQLALAVPALDGCRDDWPKSLDGPNLDRVEEDLLALTDDLESILVDGLREGVSDWQEILHVLAELRAIGEEIESFFGCILRWLRKLFGIKKGRRIERRPWRSEELAKQVRRVVEAQRQ